MMPALVGSREDGYSPPAATYYDTSFNAHARQVMAATSRRLSRGSNGHRSGAGAPMRVVKPASANNSPRTAMMQARRRTMVNDALVSRWNTQTSEQGYLSTAVALDDRSDIYGQPPAKRAARPVSWHPTSHMTVQGQTYPHQGSQYPYSTYNGAGLLNTQQFPPTPSTFSAYASPSSAFSPPSLHYSTFEGNSYFSNNWHGTTTSTSPISPSPDFLGLRAPCLPLTAQTSPAIEALPDWDSFVASSFLRAGSTPPTPEDNLSFAEPMEHKLHSHTQDTAVEEDEDEGEILIGMGLYDPPDKFDTDPTLETYRNSVAGLLGAAYKYPEPTGKGLKLEDAWEPPETDDEDEGENENDGEEADEQEITGRPVGLAS